VQNADSASHVPAFVRIMVNFREQPGFWNLSRFQSVYNRFANKSRTTRTFIRGSVRDWEVGGSA
jgi:hypothetical protein